MQKFRLITGPDYIAPYVYSVKDAEIKRVIEEDTSSAITFPNICVCTYSELSDLTLSSRPTALEIQQAAIPSRYLQFEYCNLKHLPDLHIPINTKVVFITKTVSGKMPVLENSGLDFVDIKNITITKDTLICIGEAY